MAPRVLLSSSQREALEAVPLDRAGLIEHYVLTDQDLSLIRRRRGAQNRLGFAVQLAMLRYPGRALLLGENPPTELLTFLARQLGLSAGAWASYAERDETRREHLAELQLHYGLRSFGIGHYRSLATWLMATALQTNRGVVLVRAGIDELRRRSVVIPRLAVLERLCAEVIVRSERLLFETLTTGLSDGQRHELDALLKLRGGSKVSTFTWLRSPPGAPTSQNILFHIERLQHIRNLELRSDLAQLIHQNRLLQLAREGASTTPQHIARFDDPRRYGTLVAVLLEASSTLTDEILDLHDRFVGSIFNKARRRRDEAFQSSGKAINEKVRLYARIGQALLAAKEDGADPFAAIEKIVSWVDFARTVTEAEQLAQPEDFDFLGLISNGFPQMRRYTPAMLDIFEFRAAPAAQPLLEVVDILRRMNRDKSRSVPQDASLEWISQRWRPYVVTDDGIDRRFYELCALTELKNRLRSGDVWVAGSRQFKDFDAYLLEPSRFAELRTQQNLSLPVEHNGDTYVEGRVALLKQSLDEVDGLAARGELPDAAVTESGLKISPIANAVPDEASVLMRCAYALLPHIKITDLLLEVDRWTGFSKHFTHLKTGEPAKDQLLLLTAILADGINLGISKMAEACPGTTARKLDWLASLHIRDEAYTKALAELVNHHHRHPFSEHWGEGTTSSSDGQRFRASGRGEQSGQVNLRYGNEPGVLFYTHISDQYTPFYTKVIAANARDATHVLDGLLYHESDLRIEEHYTDTAGFTDHVFALCHLLGFRFAPRIRDLADKRLYVPGKERDHPTLAPLIGGKLNLKLVRTQWEEILRLAASIRHGTVTASLIIRKLASYPRQNSLHTALREIGRIERSLFMLEWMKDPELRRRVQVGLNKGEARNALARAVFFNRQGDLRDRSFENQRYRASGLNLIVAAITLWNTVYLERAVAALREHGITIDDESLAHLSPIGWEHINLTGDYTWQSTGRLRKGAFRPLRPFTASKD
ncbi:Tn3 family transposase [Granulicella sp. dw_53]|uniref:Tn3 family transposase n=1 Tax=Granulicella sp. dw_53 TaxID=2719792 RepID=UPI001BD5C849|nr:Tn3 family transposase [Granulicella sp. dw_53]